MKLNKLFALILLVCMAGTSFGQLEENLTSNEGYYLFPIKPGVRNTLAGTMGELRSSHFHAGIDIRTEGRTGIPVQAAADGYISRVAVSAYGYGNAIYIQHPNGHTTVYAHLESFYNELADYVRQEQYRRKTFDINLYFGKDRFKVERGDIIALSGNSGSSGGPHLHFDLRDAYQRPLNPLSYGFNEVLDHTPPVVRKLAVNPLGLKARVDGQFERKEYEVRRVGNDYVIDQPVHASGLVGLELFAYDKLDNARFRCGINTIEVTVGDQVTFKQYIDKFAFSQQRNILQHMNYRDLYHTGERYHKLYVDDGNFLDFYTTQNSGKLNLNDNCSLPVKVKMTDSYGNTSYLDFTLSCEPVSTLSSDEDTGTIRTMVYDNTLKVVVSHKDSVRTVRNGPQALQPDYTLPTGHDVYLLDLSKGIPPLTINGQPIEHNLRDIIPSLQSYTFYSDIMDINFGKSDLFDTLYLQTEHYMDSKNGEVFKIGDPTIPLRKHITVTLKPTASYNNKVKQAVYSIDWKGNLNYVGGEWQADKLTFYTRDFGKFTIASDTIPPKVKPLVITQNDLKFNIEDNMSGLKSFECFVNDSWVLMNYDYKRNLIWSEKLDQNDTFGGEVKLVVTDNMGNRTIYNTKIN